MVEFHGDLLMGGCVLRNLHGTLEETSPGDAPAWSGHFEIDSTQKESVEVGRQYLLMLEDGRNAEVMVTNVNDQPQQSSLICDFGPCSKKRLPPK